MHCVKIFGLHPDSLTYDAGKFVFIKVCQLPFDATVNMKKVYPAKEVENVVKSGKPILSVTDSEQSI